MDGKRSAAPWRRPSLVEDLGTVAAVSVREDRVAWALAYALALSTIAWAPVEVWSIWYLAAAMAALPWRTLPRAATSGKGVAAICVIVGALFAVLRSDRDDGGLIWAVVGAGHALLLPWAHSLGRTFRRRADGEDGEVASARVVTWLQERPWRTVIGLFTLAGPVGALGLDAGSVLARASQFVSRSDSHEVYGLGAGLMLLIAATLQGRLLRVAEKAVIALTLAGGAYLLLTWIWLRDIPGGAATQILPVLLPWIALRFALSFLTLFAVELGLRLARRATWGARGVAIVFALALCGRACAGAVPAEVDRLDLDDPVSAWAAVALHGLPFAVLLVVLAASTLRGRWVVLTAVLLGAFGSLVVDAMTDRGGPSVAYASLVALLALNQALFVLAARRVRSMTVVPPEHALRADWAVDLAPRH